LLIPIEWSPKQLGDAALLSSAATSSPHALARIWFGGRMKKSAMLTPFGARRLPGVALCPTTPKSLATGEKRLWTADDGRHSIQKCELVVQHPVATAVA
jgi:hypothetical protein